MAPGCGWSPSRGQGGIGCPLAPSALGLGTWHSSGQEGARHPRAALPGPSVARRPVVSQPSSLHGLRHAGLGVLSQSQEMDLLCGGGGAAALGSWGEPQPPACPRWGVGAGFVHLSPGLAWI